MLSPHSCTHLYLCFFNDTATTEIYTLSLHDALPISRREVGRRDPEAPGHHPDADDEGRSCARRERHRERQRSEEHTSELQSHSDLVCRLLLEKKKKKKKKKNKYQNEERN